MLYHIYLTDKGKKLTQDQLIKCTILHHVLDHSNFEVLSKESICQPLALGYVKSELKDNIITEVIALAPKCYSVEYKQRSNSNYNVKSAVKGCPVRTAKNIYNHQIFRDMLFKDEFIPPSAFSNHIRRQKGHGIHNLRVKRTCLSLIENKRWWLTKYESLAYGHPDIPKNQYKPDDILSDVGCTIKGSIPISQSLFSNNVAVDNLNYL